MTISVSSRDCKTTIGIVLLLGTLWMTWSLLIQPILVRQRYIHAVQKIESFSSDGYQFGGVSVNINHGLAVGFIDLVDPRPLLGELQNLTGIAPPPLPFHSWDVSPRYSHLLDVPGIYFLSIERNPHLTDRSLKFLRDLPELRVLTLNETPISDRGTGFISACRNLEVLDLSRTKVSGSGLRPLARLRHLKELNLWETQVGDDFVALLCQRRDFFPALENLDLLETLVSDEAKEKLRSARPGIIIR